MPFCDALPTISSAAVRTALRAREEIALIDAREEDPFAQAHPLFAAQLPLSRIELDVPRRLPRREVLIAVYDDGEGLADRAARRLVELGYRQVHRLVGDLDGWKHGGGEVFRDVNAPSKAFGELVEHERHTPSLAADEVKALIDAKADIVVLDARRFDEYRTMSIPTGISVPGAELALRVRELAPDPATRVIVNCAGRTRSIIGAQSLVNAGIPNPVSALRNGTIGWKLAGFELDHGQTRRFGPVDAAGRARAQRAAQALAERAGAKRLPFAALTSLDDGLRTVYRYDVRDPEEFRAGHLAGFRSAPGGQLVQETDVFAPVRGARIILADDDGVRAPMTAHWLAQMGWEAHWVDGVSSEHFVRTMPALVDSFRPASVRLMSAARLADMLADDAAVVVDVSSSARYLQGHVPGAWWALRSGLATALARIETARGKPRCWVVTADDEAAAEHVVQDLAELTDAPCYLLSGGNSAWRATGRPQDTDDARLASPRIDRYRRPYEGTDNPREAMQAYLDWEYGLVEQLRRDGTHGFRVLEAAVR
ncbi:rhodanese-related sulfurtransferase [soil metagenome]